MAQVAATLALKNGKSKDGLRKRYKKDGTIYWEARWTMPGGRRTQFYGDTKGEAERNREEGKRLFAQYGALFDDSLTVQSYFASWLDTMQRKVKPTTWKRYNDLLRLHFLKELGYMPLARVTYQQVNKLYEQKLSEVHQRGTTLSPTTIHHLHTVLHKAFEDAHKKGLVPFNVIDQADAPGMPHHEMKIFSVDEQARLLEQAQGDRYEALYRLALGTGMREGELLALKWSDVDWEQGVIHVGATLHYLHGQFTFAQPKTKRSKRSIKLWPEELEALRAHLTSQKVERVKAARWDESYNLVFCNSIGRPIEASNFVKRNFHHLLGKAGLAGKGYRFHDLRHTAVTVMRRRGLPIDLISMILGHANAAFTIDRYGHLTVEMQEAYQAKALAKR